MVGLSGERTHAKEIEPHCRCCGRGGATPTVLHGRAQEFMALFPLDFWIDALCEPCMNFTIAVAKAARRKVTGENDSSAANQENAR